MKRIPLLQLLHQYSTSPYCSVEEHRSLEQTIQFIHEQPNCFERANRGHITGSAWIISSDKSKALLTHHKKLNKWLQLGGHADGDADIQRVALKEAVEESGIKNLSLSILGIFDLDIHAIPNDCAFHYDIRFLIQAPPHAITVTSAESHALAWVNNKNIRSYSQERSVIRMAEKIERIYANLND